MATKAKSKTGTPTASAANTLLVTEQEGKSRQQVVAELSLSPIVANTKTALAFARGTFGEIDLSESIKVMRGKADKVKANDLFDVETTLTVQAATLDAVFNELARRAALNMGTHMQATETYLRLALKAQAQCRSTLETLAEVKYPKAATFVRQQNVAYQQQVNNGNAAGDSRTSTRTHAHEKTVNQSNELLEAQHGERLDSRAAGTAGGDDSHVEAVATIDRPADSGRKSA